MPQLRAADRAGYVALVYRFAAFELDPVHYLLRRRGRPLAISSKSFEVLLYLVENRGRSISREELLDSLWPDVRVAGGSLTQAIWSIREALRGTGNVPPIIKTVRGLGYRFVAPVLTARVAVREPPKEQTATSAIRERLRSLPDDTRSLVLGLAAELAGEYVTQAPCGSCQHRRLQ